MDSVGKRLSMFNAKNATDGGVCLDEMHPLRSEIWKLVCDVVGMSLEEISNDGKPGHDDDSGKLEIAETLLRERIGYELSSITPHKRLVALFKESKMRMQDWGEITGHSRNTISWWIKNPAAVAMMSAEDVTSSCRLFGCTVDYLRGRTDDKMARARSDDPMSPDLMVTYYKCLDRCQKQMLSVMILEMTERNHFLQTIVGK